jgi:hypothetical protein
MNVGSLDVGTVGNVLASRLTILFLPALSVEVESQAPAGQPLAQVAQAQQDLRDKNGELDCAQEAQKEREKEVRRLWKLLNSGGL